MAPPRIDSVCSYILLLGCFLLLKAPLTIQSPFTPPGGNEDTIVIPDTGGLDSTLLKESNADKFWFYWFTRVFAAPNIVSSEPWTLLIPDNTALAKNKDITMEFLLGHVMLGKAVMLDDVMPAQYTSLMGTHLNFHQTDGKLYVNDIPVIGEPILVGEGVAYVLEDYIELKKEYSPDQAAIEQTEDNPDSVLPRSPMLSRDSQLHAPSSTASSPSSSSAATTTQQLSSTSESQADIKTTESSVVPKAPFAIKPIDLNAQNTDVNALEKTHDLSSLFSIVTSASVDNADKSLFSTSTSAPSTSVPTSSSSFSTSSAMPSTTARPKAHKKKNKSNNKNGWRPTRFDKYKNKRNRQRKGKTLITENEEPSDITNILTSANIKSTTMTIKSTTVTTTPKIPIINPDIEAEINKEVVENFDVSFGMDAEFGSGAADAAEGEFATTTFLGALKRELVGNHGTSEFLRHFIDSNLDNLFYDDHKYTCLVPSDMAFYSYYPIDWGFNPFQVPSFTRDVILNHFIEDDYHLEDLQPNKTLTVQTLGGRTLVLSRGINGTLLANGQEITKESDVQITSGRLYHLHQLLFVDQERVSELKRKYPYLETAPLLGAPWPTSQFLSHLLLHTSSEPKTLLFAEYLNLTNIAHLAPSADENLDSQDYTAFVPTDDAVYSMLFTDSPDVFSVDPMIRKKLILNSIVRGRYTTTDLVDNTVLHTLADTNLTVSVWPDGIYLNEVKVVIPESYIYNLGSVFKIEGLLGIDEKDVQNSIDQHPDAPPLWKAPLTSGSSEPPEIRYETRTEISVSQRVNDGDVVPVFETVNGEVVTVREYVAVEESVTVGDAVTPDETRSSPHTTSTPTSSTAKIEEKISALPHLRGDRARSL